MPLKSTSHAGEPKPDRISQIFRLERKQHKISIPQSVYSKQYWWFPFTHEPPCWITRYSSKLWVLWCLPSEARNNRKWSPKLDTFKDKDVSVRLCVSLADLAMTKQNPAISKLLPGDVTVVNFKWNSLCQSRQHEANIKTIKEAIVIAVNTCSTTWKRRRSPHSTSVNGYLHHVWADLVVICGWEILVWRKHRTFLKTQ